MVFSKVPQAENVESPNVQAGNIGGNLGNLRETNSSNVFVNSSLLWSTSLLIS